MGEVVHKHPQSPRKNRGAFCRAQPARRAVVQNTDFGERFGIKRAVRGPRQRPTRCTGGARLRHDRQDAGYFGEDTVVEITAVWAQVTVSRIASTKTASAAVGGQVLHQHALAFAHFFVRALRPTSALPRSSAKPGVLRPGAERDACGFTARDVVKRLKARVAHHGDIGKSIRVARMRE